MATKASKIIKQGAEPLTSMEESVAKAISDLEMSSEFKNFLHDVHITSVKQIECERDRKAIIVFVPPPQLKAFQKVNVRLCRELEKKFPNTHFLIVAQRRILPKQTRKLKIKQKQKRPRSRTLTSVHNAILDDICFPAEVTGKRTHFKTDGKKWIECFLDKSQQTNLGDGRLSSLSCVYKKLTGKEVQFKFPAWTLDGK